MRKPIKVKLLLNVTEFATRSQIEFLMHLATNRIISGTFGEFSNAIPYQLNAFMVIEDATENEQNKSINSNGDSAAS